MMKGICIVSVVLLSSFLLHAASESMRVRGFAEIDSMQESFRKLQSAIANALVATNRVEENLKDIRARKIEFPWLLACQPYLNDWKLKLEKEQLNALSIQMLLGKMKNQVREMGEDAPCLEMTGLESATINTVIQPFLQNLTEASSRLFYLMREVNDMKERARQGGSIPWRVAHWHRQLENQKHGLFRLVLGYYRLKDDVWQASMMAKGRGRSLSLPF